jgi:AcrR family transcriptional regulator
MQASLSSRELAKQANRERILEAADLLFCERGWEGTTLRDVASAVDVSTGAVFSSFRDKADLFQAVVQRDLIQLFGAMSTTLNQRSELKASLLAIFMAGYRHYDARLPFLRALHQVLWGEQSGVLRAHLNQPHLVNLFQRRLNQAVADGEIASTENLSGRSRMLQDLYAANYPRALYGAWDLEVLQQISSEQIDIVLAGALPSPTAT